MSDIRKKLKLIGKDLLRISMSLLSVDSCMFDVVLVGWRQDKYWETLDNGILRSFVSLTRSTHVHTCMYVLYVTVVG